MSCGDPSSSLNPTSISCTASPGIDRSDVGVGVGVGDGEDVGDGDGDGLDFGEGLGLGVEVGVGDGELIGAGLERVK